MRLFPIVLVALKKMLEIAKILRDFVRGLKPKLALAFYSERFMHLWTVE